MMLRLLAALTASAVGSGVTLYALHNLHTFALTLEGLTP